MPAWPFLHEEIAHELRETEATTALIVAFSIGIGELWNLIIWVVDADFVFKVPGVEFQPDTRIAPTAYRDDFPHTSAEVPVTPLEIDGGLETIAINKVAIGSEHVVTYYRSLIAQLGTEKVIEIQTDSPVFVGFVGHASPKIHVRFESLFQRTERPLIGKTGTDPNKMGGRIHLPSTQLNVRTPLGISAEVGESQK